MQRLPSCESGELEGILEERQLTRAVADDATQTLQ
jgi:hypothetical protein